MRMSFWGALCHKATVFPQSSLKHLALLLSGIKIFILTMVCISLHFYDGQVFIAYLFSHYRVHKGKEGARKIHPTTTNIAMDSFLVVSLDTLFGHNCAGKVANQCGPGIFLVVCQVEFDAFCGSQTGLTFCLFLGAGLAAKECCPCILRTLCA